MPVTPTRPVTRQGHLGIALRTAVALVLLLVAYYKAPLDRGLTLASGLLFGGALAGGALAVWLQVRRILRSPYPMLRAARLLTLGLPLLLVLFAATYITIDGQQANAFTEPLTRTDGLYFTVTTFATVGYGDIAPKSELARIIVTIQMIVGLIAVGIIAKVVLGAVRVARERNTTAESGSPRTPSENGDGAGGNAPASSPSPLRDERDRHPDGGITRSG
jgi:hypothetical protein